MNPRKKVKVLAVSYYGCMVSPYSENHTTFLTNGIVKKAKENSNEYAGFYGLTRVCARNAKHNFENQIKQYKKLIKNADDNAWLNLQIHKIQQNFVAASELKCLATITPDNKNGPQDPIQRANSGFEKILRPCEEKNFDLQIPFSQEPTNDADIERTEQIEEAIAHAIAINPGADIELDFIDQNLGRCNDVCHIPQGTFPVNVTINVYLYRQQTDELHLIDTIECGPKKPSALQLHSSFAYTRLPDRAEKKEEENSSSCCRCM